MKSVDFSRSFVTWRLDTDRTSVRTLSQESPYSLNNARVLLECRCRISDQETDQTETFVLGANCKTERVGVEQDVFTHPNADFSPVFSLDKFLYMKTFARMGMNADRHPPGQGAQPDRMSISNEENFDNVRIDGAV